MGVADYPTALAHGRPTMLLPPEARPLVGALVFSFTSPTYQRLSALLVGAVLTTGRRTVADQVHRAVGDEAVEHQPHQGAAESEAGPAGAGQDALVAGPVPGGEMAEGAEHVGHGAPTGRQQRADQECREPLVRRVGEMTGEDLHQRVRFCG